jgi:hypothetical protein
LEDYDRQTSMKMKTGALLVLIGMLIGCGAAAVGPTAVSFAQGPASGKWGCYAADRFPDTEDAAGWKRAQEIGQGLDLVATNVAAGTIISVTPKTGSGTYADVICVKQ